MLKKIFAIFLLIVGINQVVQTIILIIKKKSNDNNIKMEKYNLFF